MVEHDFLCHYGTKGMKWGIRRYQNKDGSLTAEGRARYGGERAEKYRAKLLKKAEKLANSKNQIKRVKGNEAIKNIRNASNDELAKELMNRRATQKTLAAGSATLSAAMNTANVAKNNPQDTFIDIANKGVPVTRGQQIVGSYIISVGSSAIGSFMSSGKAYDSAVINKYANVKVVNSKRK